MSLLVFPFNFIYKIIWWARCGLLVLVGQPLHYFVNIITTQWGCQEHPRFSKEETKPIRGWVICPHSHREQAECKLQPRSNHRQNNRLLLTITSQSQVPLAVTNDGFRRYTCRLLTNSVCFNMYEKIWTANPTFDFTYVISSDKIQKQS